MLLQHRAQAALTATMQAVAAFMDKQMEPLIAAARLVAKAVQEGHKVLIFGNGGSAADAQHLAAEFVNRFQIERPPLAAIALTTDTSILTAIGNDYHFQDIFAKQVAALGRPGDVAWGISTSGNSPNVVQALRQARELGLHTLAVTGMSGGKMAPLADILLAVPSTETPRIQEVQLAIGHVLVDLVDFLLFPEHFQPA
jgi:D-sedoheptulose 7-phosphate isomerase